MTFSELPNFRWPYPRTLHAKVLDQIRKGDPKAVDFDIQFSEFGTLKEDNALYDALYRNRGKTVLSHDRGLGEGRAGSIFNPAALTAIGHPCR